MALALKIRREVNKETFKRYQEAPITQLQEERQLLRGAAQREYSSQGSRICEIQWR